MRYFNKFFMSVKSYYLNDNKYSNSIFNNLRIYFERETKNKSNVSIFGNTFRNSKWSDLQKINIKESFLKTFLYTSLTTLLMVSAVMCFLGKAKSEHYLGFIPLFSLLDTVLNQTLILISESQSQLFIAVFGALTYASAKLKTILPNLLLNTLRAASTTNHRQLATVTHKLTSTTLTNKPTFNITTGLSTNPVSIFQKLYIMQDSLTLLKEIPNYYTYSLDKRDFIKGRGDQRLPMISVLSSTFQTTKPESTTISESNYGTNLSLNKLVTASMNLQNIQSYTNPHKSLTFFDFNILSNINYGKEQRWLVKNSILTEFLTKNTNMFTQSKKLLGIGNYSNNFSGKNLWLPTKLSNLNNAETLSYINNLNNSLYPSVLNNGLNNSVSSNSMMKSPSILNLNLFEYSRMWITKKFFFNNQMFNNMISHSKAYNMNPGLTHSAILSPKNNVLPNNTNLTLLNSTADLNSSVWINKSIVDIKSHTNPNNYLKSHNLSLNTQNLDLLSSMDLSFINNITSNVKSTPGTTYCGVTPTTNVLDVKSNNVNF